MHKRRNPNRWIPSPQKRKNNTKPQALVFPSEVLLGKEKVPKLKLFNRPERSSSSAQHVRGCSWIGLDWIGLLSLCETRPKNQAGHEFKPQYVLMCLQHMTQKPALKGIERDGISTGKAVSVELLSGNRHASDHRQPKAVLSQAYIKQCSMNYHESTDNKKTCY